jgi:hypothetical protein
MYLLSFWSNLTARTWAAVSTLVTSMMDADDRSIEEEKAKEAEKRRNEKEKSDIDSA